MRPASSLLSAAVLAVGAFLATSTAIAGVTVLHSFDFADGQYPEGGVIQGLDGRFYGMTYAGGANGYGEVFAVTTGGAFTILHSFTGFDGESQFAGLWQRADGMLFGTTPQDLVKIGSGFSDDGGSIFEVSPAGSFTTLSRFNSYLTTGDRPGTLVDGGDGYLYGTTNQGGPTDAGTVFRTTQAGVVSTLHSFSGPDGLFPGASLTKASDGNFYGSVEYAPSGSANGALFRMTAAGAVSTYHAFTGSGAGTDGIGPWPDLVSINDGYLYGVTSGGGTGGGGTVFKIDPAGNVTTLHAFNGQDGNGPVGGLAVGPDGNFYGLTFSGGLGGGTIFRVSPAGAFVTLHELTSQDGYNPSAAPIFGSDGRLYGTTVQYGGSTGASGSVFAFDALSPQPALLGMTKICYNEFGTCLSPFNTTTGVKFTITWNSQNLSSCVASGRWSGTQPSAGYLDVVPTRPGLYTYRLACTGPAGAKSAVVTVSVI